MYQAWLVQKFNGEPYNVVLGKHFETVEDAYDAIRLYEQCFGKCTMEHVEPSGTPIPTDDEKPESLWQTFLKLFS